MLSIMRKHATSWVIKIILGAIVLVFVFWGVGSFKEQKINTVASVNDATIKVEEYYDAYNTMIENYRRQFGDKLDTKLLDALNIKKRVVEKLIEQELLRQEFELMNFKVSDEELADYIQKISYFQKDGIFDNHLYINILQRSRMKPDKFEALQRNALLLNKLEQIVSGSAKVSDEEAKAWYNYNRETVSIFYKAFEFNSYTDITIKDDELISYFDKNKETYKTEPKVKVSFVCFDPNDYLTKVPAITDEQIQEYYDSHKDEFNEEKTVEARHILFKVDKDADQKIVEQVRSQSENIYKLAKEGKDFAQLAKEYSQDSSSEDGGNLGTFKRSDMVKPFADKAFSMNKGEIGEPIRTDYGWHIIKVENVNEPREITLVEATHTIREKLKKQTSESLAYDAVESFYEGITYDSNLIEYSLSRGITPVTTDFFTRSGPVEVKDNSYKFASYAFDMDEKQISEIKDWGKGYYVIQMIEKKAAEIPDITAVKTKVKIDMKLKKQKEIANTESEKLLAQIKQETASPDAKHYSFEKSSEAFMRNGQIADLGYEQAVIKAAFQLTLANPLPYSPIEGQSAMYVIKLKEHNLPTDEEFEKDKKETKTTLMQKKQSDIFQQWLNTLKAKSKIEIEDKFRF